MPPLPPPYTLDAEAVARAYLDSCSSLAVGGSKPSPQAVAYVGERIEREGVFPELCNWGATGCLLPHRHGSDGACALVGPLWARRWVRRYASDAEGLAALLSLAHHVSLSGPVGDLPPREGFESLGGYRSTVDKAAPDAPPPTPEDVDSLEGLLDTLQDKAVRSGVLSFCRGVLQDEAKADQKIDGIADSAKDWIVRGTVVSFCRGQIKASEAADRISGVLASSSGGLAGLAGTASDIFSAIFTGGASEAVKAGESAALRSAKAAKKKKEAKAAHARALRAKVAAHRAKRTRAAPSPRRRPTSPSAVDDSSPVTVEDGDDPELASLETELAGVDAEVAGLEVELAGLGPELAADVSGIFDAVNPFAPSEAAQKKVEEVAAQWVALKARMDKDPKVARVLRPQFDHWLDFWTKWQAGTRDENDVRSVIADVNAARANAETVTTGKDVFTADDKGRVPDIASEKLSTARGAAQSLDDAAKAAEKDQQWKILAAAILAALVAGKVLL